MKWSETTASRVPYGDVAARIFRDADIIWEDGEADGCAGVLAAMPDGTFVHYEWVCGVWPGDQGNWWDWQDRGLTDDQVEVEMRLGMVELKDVWALGNYLHAQSQVNAPWTWRAREALLKWQEERAAKPSRKPCTSKPEAG